MNELGKIVRPQSPTRTCKINPDDASHIGLILSETKIKHKSGEKLLGMRSNEIVCALSSKTIFLSNSGQVVSNIDLPYYWCNFCSFKTEDKHLLLRHLMEHRFNCQYCIYQTFSRVDVVRHTVKEHSQFDSDNLKFCVLLPDLLKHGMNDCDEAEVVMSEQPKSPPVIQQMEEDQEKQNSKRGKRRKRVRSNHSQSLKVKKQEEEKKKTVSDNTTIVTPGVCFECCICNFKTLQNSILIAHNDSEHDRPKPSFCLKIVLESQAKDIEELDRNFSVKPKRCAKSAKKTKVNSTEEEKEEVEFAPANDDKSDVNKDFVPIVKKEKVCEKRGIRPGNLEKTVKKMYKCLLCRNKISEDFSTIKKHYTEDHPGGTQVMSEFYEDGTPEKINYFCVRDNCDFKDTETSSWLNHYSICQKVNCADEVPNSTDTVKENLHLLVIQHPEPVESNLGVVSHQLDPGIHGNQNIKQEIMEMSDDVHTHVGNRGHNIETVCKPSLLENHSGQQTNLLFENQAQIQTQPDVNQHLLHVSTDEQGQQYIVQQDPLSGVQQNIHFVVQQNPDFVEEPNQESVTEQNPEFVIEQNPDFVTEQSSESEVQHPPEIVTQHSSNSPMIPNQSHNVTEHRIQRIDKTQIRNEHLSNGTDQGYLPSACTSSSGSSASAPMFPQASSPAESTRVTARSHNAPRTNIERVNRVPIGNDQLANKMTPELVPSGYAASASTISQTSTQAPVITARSHNAPRKEIEMMNQAPIRNEQLAIGKSSEFEPSGQAASTASASTISRTSTPVESSIQAPMIQPRGPYAVVNNNIEIQMLNTQYRCEQINVTARENVQSAYTSSSGSASDNYACLGESPSMLGQSPLLSCGSFVNPSSASASSRVATSLLESTKGRDQSLTENRDKNWATSTSTSNQTNPYKNLKEDEEDEVIIVGMEEGNTVFSSSNSTAATSHPANSFSSGHNPSYPSDAGMDNLEDLETCNNTPEEKQELTRLRKSARERVRIREINNAFSVLSRTVLPDSQPLPTKVMILQKTVDVIDSLHREIRDPNFDPKAQKRREIIERINTQQTSPGEDIQNQTQNTVEQYIDYSGLTPEERAKRNNARERIRVQEINKAFCELFEMVALFSKTPPPTGKLLILKEAINLITYLRGLRAESRSCRGEGKRKEIPPKRNPEVMEIETTETRCSRNPSEFTENGPGDVIWIPNPPVSFPPTY